jgi:hypothetical protein
LNRDDFYMLIEMSIACVFGGVVARQVKVSYETRRNSQRRDELLIQALQEGDSPQPAVNRPQLSGKRAEMERLLLSLRTAADELAASLAAEADSGWNVVSLDPDRQTLGQQWQAARTGVARAQQTYDRASNEYREFVQALPVPLRAKAAERGIAAMTSVHA